MESLLNKFNLQSLDEYDYGKWRTTVNKNYEKMNGIVNEIRKRKEEADRKEKEEK